MIDSLDLSTRTQQERQIDGDVPVVCCVCGGLGKTILGPGTLWPKHANMLPPYTANTSSRKSCRACFGTGEMFGYYEYPRLDGQGLSTRTLELLVAKMKGRKR